jgi:gliding motility-associated-like protein
MNKKKFEYQTIAFFFILLTILGNKAFSQPIIVDHTSVDKYQDIPEYYINEVKKMWFTLPGESHSQAYRTGLLLLESSNPTYAVSVIESGTPEAYTTSNLRASHATWGDINNASGWIYSYGEEDWFTSELAKSRTKAGITYCNTHNLSIAAIGLGWCWDPGISFTDYISATQEYIDYCVTNSYDTKIVFTTGTVDSYTGEAGYIKHLGYESIRNYVAADPTKILFDYADILCYDDDGSTNTTVWDSHEYPIITLTNLGDGSVGHISAAGALRLGKAIWYILARIAGWNGLPEEDDTEAPTVPTNLQGTALSITSAQLSWNAATDNVGVTGYNIYRNGTFVSSSTVATFTDNGLSVGNSYSYTVSAFDAAGNVSSQSTPVNVNTSDLQAPTVPTILQGAVLSVTSAQLSWTASTDNIGVTGYNIYRDGTLINSTTSTTFTDNGLSVGNSYSYTVSAFDAAGNVSGQSIPVEINISDLQAPTVPTNLQGAALSVTSAQLSWTASTDNVGVTGYRIYRDGSAIGTSATTTFTDNGLSVGIYYSYTVAAFDAAGNESGQSIPVEINTSDTQAPTVPTNLQGATLSVISAQLSWTVSTDNVGLTGYRIYRDGSAIGTSTTTTFTDNGLTVGNTYSYTITAFDAAGNESGQSTPVNVNTSDLQAPTVPKNLQGTTQITTKSAQLTWNPSTDNVGVTGYKIYRNKTVIDSTSTPSFTDNGLIVDNTYIYSVTAYDAAGNESNHCQPVLILTITGIPNVFTPNGDGINETWVIPSLDDFPDAVIRIYDRNLKQIIQYTGVDPEWDGRDSNGTALPAGAYLYVIELNTGTRPIKGYVSLIK